MIYQICCVISKTYLVILMHEYTYRNIHIEFKYVYVNVKWKCGHLEKQQLVTVGESRVAGVSLLLSDVPIPLKPAYLGVLREGGLRSNHVGMTTGESLCEGLSRE